MKKKEDYSKRKVYKTSNPKVEVTYGTEDFGEILKSLIMLDLQQDQVYNNGKGNC